MADGRPEELPPAERGAGRLTSSNNPLPLVLRRKPRQVIIPKRRHGQASEPSRFAALKAPSNLVGDTPYNMRIITPAHLELLVDRGSNYIMLRDWTEVRRGDVDLVIQRLIIVRGLIWLMNKLLYTNTFCSQSSGYESSLLVKESTLVFTRVVSDVDGRLKITFYEVLRMASQAMEKAGQWSKAAPSIHDIIATPVYDLLPTPVDKNAARYHIFVLEKWLESAGAMAICYCIALQAYVPDHWKLRALLGKDRKLRECLEACVKPRPRTTEEQIKLIEYVLGARDVSSTKICAVTEYWVTIFQGDPVRHRPAVLGLGRILHKACSTPLALTCDGLFRSKSGANSGLVWSQGGTNRSFLTKFGLMQVRSTLR